MQEGSLTFRIARTAAAAGMAMVHAMLVLAVVLLIGLPLMRIAADWYVRGRIELAPVESLPAGPEIRLLAVKNGTATETASIRAAVGGLRYRIDPRTISVVIVDEDPFAAGFAAEYLPYLDVIRIQRAVVDGGGAVLRWTMAHEIGHYVDQRYMTPASRQRFKELRGIPAALTWESPTEPWARRPVEDFGEVFAAISQTSVMMTPGTVYGPVRDPAAFESLLKSVGVTLGREPPARTWQEVLVRELKLVVDTVTDPSLLRPLTILFGVYLFVSAAGPAYHAWKVHDDAEGVPLDRGRTRVLNTYRRTLHRTGR